MQKTNEDKQIVKTDDSDLTERLNKLRQASEARKPSDRIKRLWNFQNQIYIDQSKQSDQDSLHWEKFKANHLNDKFFALKHVEDIGLPFDVAMVLTKRGTGKTYSYMQMLEKVASKGEEFVIVRNTKQEIEGGVMEQFCYSWCPFEVVKNKVYWRGQPQVVGYLAHLNGKSQQWQGAGYEKVTTIIWDEATNAGDTSTQTRKWIRAFWQLTSTFFRNRIDGKCWVFGNLMKDSEQKISDMLHNYLGIDSDVNFKYIINNTENGEHTYRLLYLNTGGLYKGADTHLMSNVSVSKEIRMDLASNAPSKMGECIVPEYYFTKAKEKMWGILTQFDKRDWMILIAREPWFDLSDPNVAQLYQKGELGNSNKSFFIVRCEPLNIGMMGFDMRLVTDDSNLWNMYKAVTTLKHPDKMKKYWFKLYKIIKSGNTCYIGDHSYTELCRIMSGRKDAIHGYKKMKEEKIRKMKLSKQKK